MLPIFTLLVATTLAAACGAEAAEIKVVTWGGAYEQAQRQAYFQPFKQEADIDVTVITYDGSFDAIKKLIEDGGADVIDVSSSVLKRLCDEGLLAKLDLGELAPSAPGSEPSPGANDQTAANPPSKPRDDYLGDSVSKCGVGSAAWSASLVYYKTASGAVPDSASAFLDLKRFPGKRALPNEPRYTLELALMADGVPPADVYATLATEEGLTRAFATLDKIRPEILWWSNPQKPIDWLRHGRVRMALSYTGRIFRNAIEAPDRVGLLWDGQIYEIDFWAVPEDSEQQEEALRFVSFASTPARMAEQATLTAYGPMRRSAIPLVGKHPEIGVEMRPFLPTAPENFERALRFDQGWWDTHGETVTKRFWAWRRSGESGAGDNGETAQAPKAD